jgi:dihydrofolate synthase/folylpolyglutamate synthase
MKVLKDYNDALDFLYSQLPMFHRIGAAAYKKDLKNTILLLEAVGNPHLDLKCIHVAGTNGKGSVSHMIASVLQEHGYNVGLYTSPHYRVFEERIKINGVYMEHEFLIHFLNDFSIAIKEIQPSFFELTVAMAFLYFKQENVDYAVIETGLGGRLDSTNVIDPLLSIVTNISYDHKDLLGDTLELIAEEKAGIIKQVKPVVIGRRQKETEAIFIDHAKRKHSMLYFAEQLTSLENETDDFEDPCFNLHSLDTKLNFKFKPDLKGVYQLENYNTVTAACYVLMNKCNIKLETRKIKSALENVIFNTNILGRWQKINVNPDIYAESAHNEDGIRMLLRQLDYLKYERLHIVIGFVKDKSIEPVLALLPKWAKYYFAAANIPRALDAVELQQKAKLVGLKGKSYVSVKKALNSAKMSRRHSDIILVTGSIFVVAEII